VNPQAAPGVFSVYESVSETKGAHYTLNTERLRFLLSLTDKVILKIASLREEK